MVTTQFKLGALTLAAALSLTACAEPEQATKPSENADQSTTINAATDPIDIDGSSTVYPITEAIAQEFASQASTEVSVDFSGTSGGFAKFCAGETDINNASRPITTTEMQDCREAGVPYIELPIAFDALTVVVSPDNDWAENVTVEELKKIWEPTAEGQITRWNQVRSSWPDRPINLYGPGSDSGTFDYFTEAVVGEAQASRSDYTASEDDTELVDGIRNDPNALGYFGYAYYEANPTLKALAVDSGEGAVAPSPTTVERAEYQPLARPLFIYINATAAQENAALRDFVEFYLERAPEVVTQIGYVPLPEEGYKLAEVHFNRFKVGTVFEGQSEFSLTLGELLRKQAQF